MQPADRVPAERAGQMTALFGATGLGVCAGTGDLITEANDELLRILGRDRADLAAGLSWPALTPAEHLERDAAALEQVRHIGSSVVLKELLRPDQTTVPTLLVVAATGWDPYRWVAIAADLSTDERLSHMAWSEAAIVSTLLEDAPLGFAFISPDLRFVRVNRELAAMNGFTVAEHEGVGVFDLLPGLRDTAEPLLQRVLDTGEPLRDVEIQGTTPADPGTVHTWLESFFPIRAPHGPTLGVAAIARDETEVRALQAELAQTSAKLREAMTQVQDTLLPRSLPAPDGYCLAARYWPAETAVGMGGDWYDAVQTADGHLVVTVGDVVGHGIDAIGLMARASSAIRAYVIQGHRPAEVLRHLDTLFCADPNTGLATAVVARIDLTTGATEIARAAHPYPVLLTAAGHASVLDGPGGPIVGAFGSAHFPTTHTALAPGDSLLLYTDGLIERRDHTLGDSTDELRDRAAAGHHASVDPDADALLDFVMRNSPPPDERRDDICAILVRRDRAS